MSQRRPGAIALISIIMVSAFALAVVTSMALTMTNDVQQGGLSGVSEQTYQAAEGGLQDALLRISQDLATASYTTTIADIPVAVTIAGATFPKTVTSTATDATGVVRTVETQVHASSYGGFAGAVLAGTGGFTLDNGAAIVGDICANGNIEGQSANATSVTGNIDVAGSGHRINKVSVTGAVRADIVTDVKVTGSIAYGSSVAGSTVGGVACPNANCTAGLSPLPTCAFPPLPGYLFTKDSSDPNYDDSLYKLALDGGTTGTVALNNNETRTIGPIVVNGDITLRNNSELILTGPVWVTGTISFTGPGASITLDPATFPAGKSSSIVSEQPIDVKNNGEFRGSGLAKSFLLVATTSTSSSAIVPANNNTSAIFYAPVGTVDLSKNGVSLSNATGQTVKIGNGTITYDSGLLDLIISGSSNVVVTTVPGSWIEK